MLWEGEVEFFCVEDKRDCPRLIFWLEIPSPYADHLVEVRACIAPDSVLTGTSARTMSTERAGDFPTSKKISSC